MVSASFDDLMRQGPMAAGTYMREAVEQIDSCFGMGYAEANPALVAEFMRSCTLDVNAASMGKVIGEIADILNALVVAYEEANR